MELTAYNGNTYTARYTGFRVGDSDSKYKLHYISYDKENSNVGTYDALGGRKGWEFSTIDQDNDILSTINCAEKNGGGGWWYDRCGYAWLTGLNLNNEMSNSWKGIVWRTESDILPYGFTGSWPKAEMKIRKSDVVIQTTATSPIPVFSSTTDDKTLVTIGLSIALAASLLTNAGLIICLINMKMKTKSNSPSSSSGSPKPPPGEMASSVKADGKPKRREDLLYQNIEDTEEQYYSRADSRYKSVNYDDM